MTVENCIKLLEAYKKQAEYPVNTDGAPLTGDRRKHSISQSLINYENMKNHILRSKKFRDHPILQELQKTEEKDSKPKGKPKKAAQGI